MAPFEILGGSHPPDVRRGSRRFFQYHYQLRIISRRCHRPRRQRAGADDFLPRSQPRRRGRRRSRAATCRYLMPAMPIKVLSLVPADAADIRDASEASLGAVEALRFRSQHVRGAGARARRARGGDGRARARAAGATARGRDERRCPNRVARSRGAGAVRPTSWPRCSRGPPRDGWTDDAVARALAAMRLVAAAAIGHADQPDSVEARRRGARGPAARVRTAAFGQCARPSRARSRPTTSAVARIAAATTSSTMTHGNSSRACSRGWRI